MASLCVCPPIVVGMVFGYYWLGFKLGVGMFRLVVRVYACEANISKGIALYERQIDCASSVNVDYNGLTKTLLFLYGTKAVISFEIHPF